MKPAYKIRLIIATIVGLVFGYFSIFVVTSMFRPPVYVRNSTDIIYFPNYIGIVIDRTRTNWCELQTSRVVYQSYNYQGEQVPMFFALPVSSFIWPELGREKIIALIPLPKDLPSGNWQLESEKIDNCNWFNLFIGNRLIVTKPVAIKLGN
jgi:hypothetical protein